jgi:hypothetical protein
VGVWARGDSIARPNGVYSWQLGACLPAALITPRPAREQASRSRPRRRLIDEEAAMPFDMLSDLALTALCAVAVVSWIVREVAGQYRYH